MPIYEYKCPNGHLFEVFHGMTEPGPQVCEVCGAAPLQVVLHPVAGHYKGSGFYSTDYGRKGKKPVSSDSSSSESSSGRSLPLLPCPPPPHTEAPSAAGRANTKLQNARA